MSQMDRRSVLGGMGCAAGLVVMPALAAPRKLIWSFDSLKRIGGLAPQILGAPRLVATPLGKAVEFDGVNDALFFDEHPLAGAARFTFEVLFRPNGGAFQQRWFHLEEAAPAVMPGTGNTRILFEIRVVGQEWYLDTHARGAGYAQTLIVPDKRFPIGRWYHVAQTYDGTTYRSYVDGALQAEAAMPFVPQGPGRASVGMRMNRVYPFRGAVHKASFLSGEAGTPGTFVLPYPKA